ncbi:hypothetical protein Tco_1137809 [Tanacetum coccineum]
MGLKGATPKIRGHNVDMLQATTDMNLSSEVSPLAHLMITDYNRRPSLQELLYYIDKMVSIEEYLPVPSLSTTSTMAFTSETENGRRIPMPLNLLTCHDHFPLCP